LHPAAMHKRVSNKRRSGYIVLTLSVLSPTFRLCLHPLPSLYAFTRTRVISRQPGSGEHVINHILQNVLNAKITIRRLYLIVSTYIIHNYSKISTSFQYFMSILQLRKSTFIYVFQLPYLFYVNIHIYSK